MKPTKRKDFTIKPNMQTNRTQVGLWNVCLGREHITTCRSEDEAAELAKQLNLDPWFQERGQSRKEKFVQNKVPATTPEQPQ